MNRNILVTKASLPPMEEYIEEIKSIWDSNWLTNMGDKHKRFQHMLEEYMNVDSIHLFVNGHMALEMTLQAFEMRGEVITTPFTFASTTHAIVRNGLTPVFCDINPNDYTIDVDMIESLITEKTCAILPVHVYGNICNVEKIETIARKYKLKVIYDAAHAFGEKYHGIGVGNFGDASMFSFHATKVFNSIEGGCVCYHDTNIGERLYDLKNFGIKGQECVETVGANAKMNEFQAAMGICNLKYVDTNIGIRKKLVKEYQNLLKGIDGVTVWNEQEGVEHNYSYFPIQIFADDYGNDRDGLFDLLLQNGICARKYFYPLTSDFGAYRGRFSSDDTPIARDISNRILTLPLYPDLNEEIVEKICTIIRGNRV